MRAAAILLLLAATAGAQEPPARFVEDSKIRPGIGGLVEDGTVGGFRFVGGRSSKGLPTITMESVPGSEWVGDIPVGPPWTGVCRVDEMTDARSCAAMLRRPHDGKGVRTSIMIFRSASGAAMVAVGSDHFPGQPAFVRLDEQPAIRIDDVKTGLTGADAEKFLTAAASASKVRTRHREWPYERDIDASFDARAIPVADRWVKWALKQ